MKHKSRFEVAADVSTLNHLLTLEDGSSEIFEHINADKLTEEQLEMIWFANYTLMNSFKYRKRIFTLILDAANRKSGKKEQA